MNHAIGGLDPWGYHAVNVVLHALVSVLVFWVARHLGLSRLPAFAAGALFATHAVHTEAVANVAGRAELLAAAFFLTAFLGHVRSGGTKPRWSGFLAAAALAYLLALLAKENAITFLGVVFLYDFLFRVGAGSVGLSRIASTVRAHAGAYAVYATVTAAYLALRLQVLGTGGATPPTPPLDNPLAMLDFPWRILTAFEVTGRYLGLLLAPIHLSYDYSYAEIPLVRSWVDPRAWLVLLGVAAALVFGRYAYRTSRLLFFTIGFFVIPFSVVSNWLVPIGTIMAERLLYLPSVGFCLGVGWVVSLSLERIPGSSGRWRAAVAAGVSVLVLAHAARSVERSGDWESNERLYLHDVEVSPRSAKALNNAGWILIDRDLDPERGVALLERALEIWPDDPEFLDSLGWGYYKLGRYAEARRVLRRSLALAGSGPTFPDRKAHLEAVERAIRAQRSRGTPPAGPTPTEVP